MKKVSLLVTVVFIAFIVLGMMSSASAIIIDPSTEIQWNAVDDMPSPEINNPNSSEDINAIVGFLGELSEVYYANVNAEDFTINISGGPITGDSLFLVVKDGDHDPIWYIFDLLHLDLVGDTTPDEFWNGSDPIELSGFWPEQGSISHVSIWSDGVSVPEPATVLLLGIGLVSLTIIGRKVTR
jgi:hypothetical protein